MSIKGLEAYYDHCYGKTTKTSIPVQEATNNVKNIVSLNLFRRSKIKKEA